MDLRDGLSVRSAPSVFGEQWLAHQLAPLHGPDDWADVTGVLENYRRHRDQGDKEHRRETDKVAGSVSPQKLYGVPVALMFYEGARRLREAGVLIPGMQDGCRRRVVVEGYPGIVARQLVGRLSYKSETRRNQTAARRLARDCILRTLAEGGAQAKYGTQVPNYYALGGQADFVGDPTGDCLDALLCSVQAAWAWREGAPNFGLRICPTEGWIADPIWQR